MGADTLVAIVIGLAAYFYLVYRFGVVWPDKLEESLRLEAAVPNKRLFHEFVTATPWLDASDHRGEAAVFLGDQVSKLYDEVIAAAASLDVKATTILGFVGGGVSVFALTVEAKITTSPHLSPLLVLAVVFFLGSLCACLGCLYTRFRSGLPELREQFAVVQTLNDRDTTLARAAAFIFIAKQDRLDLNRPINAYKARWVELAHYLFAFGAIAIVLNYGVVAVAGKTATSNAAVTTGNCTISTKNASTTFECTTKGDSHGP